MSPEPCDGCGENVPDALARTLRLSVDRSNIDTQRLCPECFANWIAHYQNEMSSNPTASPTAGHAATNGADEGDDAEAEEEDDSTDIIVD